MSAAARTAAAFALLALAAGPAGCRMGHARVDDAPDVARRPGCHCAHAAGDGATGAATDAAAAAPLPGTSLYQLDAAWTTQDGAPFRLASLRGSPALVVLFYGTCRSACPVLIEDVRRTEAALEEGVRRRTRVVLITFDPRHDTPAQLRALARERGLDLSRWVLLHGAEGDVREAAMALGVQYSEVGDGQFSHSNVITLLGPDGAVVHQVEGLQQPTEEMARRITALVR